MFTQNIHPVFRRQPLPYDRPVVVIFIDRLFLSEHRVHYVVGEHVSKNGIVCRALFFFAKLTLEDP